jgi:FMN phosphatase YigB (HAD superfamily)
MKTPRAILCDVYRTILQITPAPVDAETRWQSLLARTFDRPPDLSLEELSGRADEFLKADHQAARALGIVYPEVDWKFVMQRALPELDSIGTTSADDFIFHHMQLLRTLGLMPGAGRFLGECIRRKIPLGIASNAQAYTLRELGEALHGSDVSLANFDRDLTCWSFENGFSKPDPHVFRILASRLKNRGIDSADCLMIGDREDNDIVPAAAQGFQTWRLDETEETGWTAFFQAVFAEEDQRTP